MRDEIETRNEKSQAIFDGGDFSVWLRLVLGDENMKLKALTLPRMIYKSSFTGNFYYSHFHFNTVHVFVLVSSRLSSASSEKGSNRFMMEKGWKRVRLNETGIHVDISLSRRYFAETDFECVSPGILEGSGHRYLTKTKRIIDNLRFKTE